MHSTRALHVADAPVEPVAAAPTTYARVHSTCHGPRSAVTTSGIAIGADAFAGVTGPLLDLIGQGAVLLGPDGAATAVSAVAAPLLRDATGALDVAPGFLDRAGISLSAEEGLSVVSRLRDGRAVETRWRCLADGRVLLALADVTAVRRQHDASAAAIKDYRSLFENTAVGIYRSSLDGRQLRANPAYVRMNGYRTEAEMLDAMRDIAQQWYVDPGRRDEFVRRVHENGVVTDFISEVYRHKTGERMWVSETGWLVRDATGTPLYYEGTIIDASERMRAEAEIAQLAHFDPLTGLANRSLFARELERCLARPDPSLALLYLDLDDFKTINDTLGHPIGDALLRQAAERLVAAVGEQHLVARFGGDEFSVLVRDAPSLERVATLAQAIIAALSAPFYLDDKEAAVGVSVGVALSPEHGSVADEVMRNADIALYQAKAAGRRTFVVFNADMDAAIQERRALETDLRLALGRDELELYYQPIIDVVDGRLRALEALLRWNHPTRGLILPGAFVTLAEEAGLMHVLGEWVIRRACSDLARLPEDVSIAVNLSPVQFRAAGLERIVAGALADHDLDPHRLEIEVTESVLLVDDPLTRSILDGFRALGITLALDDFGIGFSSLSYLQKFTFDKIKVDRSFAMDIDRNATGAALVRTIVALGRDLGISVVAEGVETEQQLAALLREGCRCFQGYYFGRPAPLSDALHDALRRLIELDQIAGGEGEEA
jgi:diguanylate cyclase (GGDEF)-like protein/PAS domain S-box-containing protein